jgi:valyl-tRNA synthetase
LGGLVDVATERQRLGKELEQTRQQIQRVIDLTSKPDFKANAPEEVKEREESRLAALRERLERLEEFLSRLG